MFLQASTVSYEDLVRAPSCTHFPLSLQGLPPCSTSQAPRILWLPSLCCGQLPGTDWWNLSAGDRDSASSLLSKQLLWLRWQAFLEKHSALVFGCPWDRGWNCPLQLHLPPACPPTPPPWDGHSSSQECLQWTATSANCAHHPSNWGGAGRSGSFLSCYISTYLEYAYWPKVFSIIWSFYRKSLWTLLKLHEVMFF